MSASVQTNTASWRKRSREDDNTTQMDLKRPRYYYYRLESESSKASEEDTESVCSLQDRETDVVRDTTDTDSKSESSDQDEYEVHYEEYEVASLSESEDEYGDTISSSGSEDMMLAAAAVAICDSSLETWITDCEDSDNSSLDDTSFGKTDFSTCIQCKSENDNPLYRYCEKCFQSCRQCKMRKTFKCFPLCITCHKDRKKLYPPRPKRLKKSRNTKKKKPDPPVKLDTLRSCLSGLSQDSGIGSSQECPPLDLDQIIVPDQHLTSGTSQISTIADKGEDDKEKKIISEDVKSSDIVVAGSIEKSCTTVQEVKGSETASSPSSIDLKCNSKHGRKRHLSESSLSDFDAKKPKMSMAKQSTDELLSEKPLSLSQTSDLGSEISSSSFISSLIEKSSTESETIRISSSDTSELCIFCNDAPKDAIFLHSKIAHQCCCYKCAKRTLKSIKRCPICNCTVNKVFRLIKS